MDYTTEDKIMKLITFTQTISSVLMVVPIWFSWNCKLELKTIGCLTNILLLIFYVSKMYIRVKCIRENI